MSSTIPFTGRRAWTRSIQRPDRSVKADRFASCTSTSVSKRPIWLAEAAHCVTARPPTIQRMPGSRPSRSASFTSSYPASRPKTDWRSCAISVWRLFWPVLVSARTSPARSVRPRASSRSRKASSPASDVTFEPWSSSLRRWSKATRRAAPSASPAAPSISSPALAVYSFVQYTEIGLAPHPATCASGECGINVLVHDLAVPELDNGNKGDLDGAACRRDAGQHPVDLARVSEAEQHLVHEAVGIHGTTDRDQPRALGVPADEVVAVEAFDLLVPDAAGHSRNVV